MNRKKNCIINTKRRKELQARATILGWVHSNVFSWVCNEPFCKQVNFNCIKNLNYECSNLWRWMLIVEHVFLLQCRTSKTYSQCEKFFEGVWQCFKCSMSDNECQAYLCDMEVLVIRHETREECRIKLDHLACMRLLPRWIMNSTLVDHERMMDAYITRKRPHVDAPYTY